MKRLIAFAVIAAFVFVLPASHLMAKAEKVDICHVNSANDVFLFPFGGGIAFGKGISVSEDSVEAHEKHDGNGVDPAKWDYRTQEEIDQFELIFGVSLPNANCSIALPQS